MNQKKNHVDLTDNNNPISFINTPTVLLNYDVGQKDRWEMKFIPEL